MTKNDIVPELTNAELESFTKKGVVFLDFFAEWCMPCVMMSPIIDDLGEDFEGKVKFGKINIDDNQNSAQKFEISSIPTFVLIKDGKVVEKINGTRSQDELSGILKKYL